MFMCGVLALIVAIAPYKLSTGLSAITGAPVGITSVQVQPTVYVTLPVNSVNFGNVSAGIMKNTTNNDPLPFLIRNDGTVEVNVSIARDNSSSPLFSGTGGGDNSSSFQFKAAVAGEGVSANPLCSTLQWTSVPGTNPRIFLCEFNYVDTNDEAEIELLINVHVDEPAGSKYESLIFTATAS